MKRLRHFLCLLLAGSFMLLTACVSGGKVAGSTNSPTTEGRYVESDITPPIEGRFKSFLSTDGTIVCISEDLQTRYDSVDGGASWTQKPGFEGVSGEIQAGTLLSDGSALVFIQGEGLSVISPEGDLQHFSVPEIDETIASGENVMVNLLQALENNKFIISYMVGGMVTQVRGSAQTDEGGTEGGGTTGGGGAPAGGEGAAPPEGATNDMSESEAQGGPRGQGGSGNTTNGTFTAGGLSSKTLLCDLAAESVVAELPMESASAATSGDGDLYVLDGSGTVEIFSLESGSASDKKNISFSGSSSNSSGMFGGMLIGGSGGGNALALDKSGRLFAPQNSSLLMADTGGLVETVLDSAAYSIGTPNSQVDSVLAPEDGSILINLRSGDRENRLYKYVWNENATINPDKTLSIWSLEDNSFVRAAISELRKKNPDALITYEVALSGDNAVSVDDAIKSLNTRLIGGSGPDIILLDGCPAQSYADKGMLLDLSELIDSSDVYANLLTAFESDSGLYCLPTQLYIPTLMGSAEALEQINSFEELVALAVSGNDLPANQDGPGAFSGVAEGERAELYFNDLDELFDVTWSANAPAVVADNKLNTEALRTYLESVKALSDKYNLTAESEGNRMSVAFAGGGGAPAMLTGSLIRYTMQVTNYGAFTFGNLQLLQMMMERDGSEIKLLPGLANGTWQPSAIVGVSVDTKVSAFAAEFVQSMLSLNVQQINYGTGLPVTHAGIAAQIDSINEQRAENDQEPFELDADSLINQLQTPSMSDTVLTDLIWVTIEKFCNNQTDLEGAVKEIEQNVKNYLAERA